MPFTPDAVHPEAPPFFENTMLAPTGFALGFVTLTPASDIIPGGIALSGALVIVCRIFGTPLTLKFGELLVTAPVPICMITKLLPMMTYEHAMLGDVVPPTIVPVNVPV